MSGNSLIYPRDLFAPDPSRRFLSPEDRAERQGLEDQIEAAEERRDLRERLAPVMESLVG